MLHIGSMTPFYLIGESLLRSPDRKLASERGLKDRVTKDLSPEVATTVGKIVSIKAKVTNWWGTFLQNHFPRIAKFLAKRIEKNSGRVAAPSNPIPSPINPALSLASNSLPPLETAALITQSTRQFNPLPSDIDGFIQALKTLLANVKRTPLQDNSEEDQFFDAEEGPSHIQVESPPTVAPAATNLFEAYFPSHHDQPRVITLLRQAKAATLISLPTLAEEATELKHNYPAITLLAFVLRNPKARSLISDTLSATWNTPLFLAKRTLVVTNLVAGFRKRAKADGEGKPAKDGLQAFIPGFAAYVDLSEKTIQSYIDTQKWTELIEFLLTNVTPEQT